MTDDQLTSWREKWLKENPPTSVTSDTSGEGNRGRGQGHKRNRRGDNAGGVEAAQSEAGGDTMQLEVGTFDKFDRAMMV
jgi:hypothetical protein|eukprot:COSAG01_NODE_15197_length_1362_cov_37.621536_2_plen_79_part_00